MAVKALQTLPEAARKKARRRAQPSWCNPMLATLSHEPFSDPDWLFEPKLDGIRCLAFRKDRHVELFSRNQLSLNGGFPTLIPALQAQAASDFIVDGEIVAMESGVSRFELLQQRARRNVRVFYYLFDVLYIDGHDVTQLALIDRKQLLHDAFSFKDPLRYSRHREAAGEAYFSEACRNGWEGLIAKRAASIYVHQRSKDWLKLKCENRQEFVIVGYTAPKGSRVGLGALLLGYYDGDALRYAGKVGTGFDTATLRSLHKRLSGTEHDHPTVDGAKEPGAHWVRPTSVAQVAFGEWTRDGKLRHPRYLGLRTDKNPKDVVRESR